MKYIFGMDRTVVERLEESWAYLDAEYGIYEWPEIFKPLFELCLHTTISEIISLHYMYGYDIEEYLHHCNWNHVEDFLNSAFDNDLDDMNYNTYVSSLDTLLCNSNGLATYVMRRRAGDRFSMSDHFDYDDMINALIRATIEAVSDTVRSVEFISVLPDVRMHDHMQVKPVQDVQVNLGRLNLLIQH